MHKISKSNKFSYENVLTWSSYSIVNYVGIIFLIYLYTKISNQKKLRLQDRFNISTDFWLRVIDLTIIAPVIETAAILCFIYFAKKYVKSNAISYIATSCVFGSLHLLSGSFSLVILVIATFQVQMLYLFIRSNYVNFKIIWLEGALIHGVHNFFIFMVSYLKILH